MPVVLRVLLILALSPVLSALDCVAFNLAGSGAAAAAIPRYDISVRILPEARRLEGVGTVLLPADASKRPLELKLSEQMIDLSAEVLEPAESAGAVRLERGEAKGGSVVWKAHPPAPFPPSKPVRLRLSWSGGEKTAFVFNVGPEGSFAGGLNTAWYPQVGGGAGTGRLRLSVPAGYTAHGVGLNRGTREDESRGLFTFEADWPTYFGFVAARYTVVRRAGTVPMSAYLLRPRRDVEKYLEGCSRILDVLVREFGPYPFGEFAVVEVPDEQAALAGFSGASVDGFIMADATSLDEDFNLAYYGHEIAHQWWGNLIKRRGPRGNYMLDEAMAQYGSLRAVEIIEGPAAAERYRRTGHPGYIAAQSGFGYLQRAAAGIDHALANLPDGRDSHLLSDSKGFFVWDMLSRTVGREKFRGALQRFTREHAFREVTWEEFLRAIEVGAGRDLRRFYAQWLERTGAPEWRLAWSQEGPSVRITITQPQPYYEAHVEVRVSGQGQHLSREVRIAGPRTEITLPTSLRAESVVLDPHFLTLWWAPEYRAEADALAPYTSANRALSAGKYAQAEEEFKTALGNVRSPDVYGLRFMLEYGRGLALYNQKKWADARSHLMAALAAPSRRPDQLPRVYYRLALIGKELRDDEALRWAVDSAVTADALDPSKSGTARRATQLLPAGRSAAECQTTVTGTLAGHDGRPMPKAHVHLWRVGGSGPLASVEAAKDGGFRLTTAETGLLTLQFTGVDHQSRKITLFADKPQEIAVEVRLKANDYAEEFGGVKIIGDFNEFSFKSARPMERLADGTFAAEFDTSAARFSYQLIGVAAGGGSVNGTQSEDYVYDGGGDYRSVVTPKGGRVRIVFDPKALSRSGAPGRAEFIDPSSIAARFASIYEDMLGRRERLRQALVAYKKTGQPTSQFVHDWSPDLADLSRKIPAEKDPLLRQALLFSYLDLGFGTYGAKLDAALARRALSEIAPTSRLWSIEPTLVAVAVSSAGRPEGFASYVRELINSHPDPAVVTAVKAELSPDRRIMIGKTVPAFSLASSDQLGVNYSAESLRGKAVLIDFWATWCVPCVEEMPNLHQAYEKFGRRGFEILSVSLDEKPESVKEFRKRWKMPWHHALLSSGSEVMKQFEIVGIPKAVLIGRDGRIVATDRELRGRNLDRTLTRALGAAK